MERAARLLKQRRQPAEANGDQATVDAPTSMSDMIERSEISNARDICVLLRAHGEQQWLLSVLLPVLRQVERPGSVPEDQLGAALAYLELLWLDARRRAAETDAALARLQPADTQPDLVLYEKARRYHAAVRRLRSMLARRVAQRMQPAPAPVDVNVDLDADNQHAHR